MEPRSTDYFCDRPRLVTTDPDHCPLQWWWARVAAAGLSYSFPDTDCRPRSVIRSASHRIALPHGGRAHHRSGLPRDGRLGAHGAHYRHAATSPRLYAPRAGDRTPVNCSHRYLVQELGGRYAMACPRSPAKSPIDPGRVVCRSSEYNHVPVPLGSRSLEMAALDALYVQISKVELKAYPHSSGQERGTRISRPDPARFRARRFRRHVCHSSNLAP